MSLGLFLIYSKIGGLKMKRKGGDTPTPPGPDPVDKSILESTINSVDSLVEGDYTPETWGDVVIALSNAETVFLDEEATQQDVDDAEEALSLAIANLEPAEGP